MNHEFQVGKGDPTTLSVLHLISGDLWAGAESLLYNLALAQHSSPQTTVSVIVLNDGILAKRLREAGIPVHIVPESRHGFIATLFRIHRFARELHPDIIHSHRQKENILAGIVTLLLPTTHSIRTVHGGHE